MQCRSGGGKISFRTPGLCKCGGGGNHFPKAWKRKKSLEAYGMGFKNNGLQVLYDCEIPEAGRHRERFNLLVVL